MKQFIEEVYNIRFSKFEEPEYTIQQRHEMETLSNNGFYSTPRYKELVEIHNRYCDYERNVRSLKLLNDAYANLSVKYQFSSIINDFVARNLIEYKPLEIIKSNQLESDISLDLISRANSLKLQEEDCLYYGSDRHGERRIIETKKRLASWDYDIEKAVHDIFVLKNYEPSEKSKIKVFYGNENGKDIGIIPVKSVSYSDEWMFLIV